MKLVFVTLKPSPRARPIKSQEELAAMPYSEQKRYASIVASSALYQYGLNPRRRCSVCRIKSRSPYGANHAHHEDYTKPLEVVFLCPSHHRQRHVELGWGHPKNKGLKYSERGRTVAAHKPRKGPKK